MIEAKIEKVIEKLSKFQISGYKIIHEGYSEDIKVLLSSKSHKYILRVSDIKNKERKKSEFDYMKINFMNGVLCPAPLEFKVHENLGICTLLLLYLEGDSADKIISALSDIEIYNIAYKAGLELKKIHKIKKIDKEYFKKRYNKYLLKKEIFNSFKLSFKGQNIIEKFIDENKHLLKEDEVTFLHDDYHLSNIIINKNEFVGVIDFNRFSFGNIEEEFFKLPKYVNQISKTYSVGQIKAYFNNEIPKKFWKKYNLFVALNFHSSYIEGYKNNEMTKIEERQNRILKEHNFKENIAPNWFTDEEEKIRKLHLKKAA